MNETTPAAATPPTTPQPIPVNPNPVASPQVSNLPNTVQALRRIEKANAPAPSVPTPPSQPLKAKISSMIPWTGRARLALKIFLGCGGLLFLFVICMLAMTFTQIDTQVIKITLEGIVKDEDGKAVANASIKIDSDHVTVSGADGRYSIGGLNPGRYNATVTAEGYEDLTQEVPVARTFMNYTSRWDFELDKAGAKGIRGKLITSDSTYQFLDDRIVVDDKNFSIDTDGTFELTDIRTGLKTLTYESTYYKDVVKQFELEEDDVQLEDIVLTPAGDISGSLKSWLREDTIANLNILAETVDSDNIIKDEENATFLIKDLEVGKTYRIRTDATGYETRDYNVTIDQGPNEIFNFRIVENGFIPYIKEINNQEQIFVANFDGQKQIQLTSERTEPYGEYISGDYVYYMSTRDNVSSNISGRALLAYRVNLATGASERLTVNTNNIGRVIPNLAAQKLANVYKGSTTTERILEIMNLAGGNRVRIQTIPEGTFNDVVFSQDGRFIYFHMQNREGTIDGLYRAPTDASSSPQKIADKTNILIYTVSNNGDRVVYSAVNEETNQLDLYMYIVSSSQDITLIQTFKGSQYQFVQGSNELLLFQEMRNGKNNVYTLNVNNNAETQLTSFQGTEGVDAVYQQGGMVIYQTNNAIYALDLAKPKLNKKVTDDFMRYTGYDF